MAEYFFDLPVELLCGLVQIDAKQDVWLTRAVFTHVLRLLIKTGVYHVILVPGDKAPRPAVLSVVQPITNSWYVALRDLARPCVREPSSTRIHFEDMLDQGSSN